MKLDLSKITISREVLQLIPAALARKTSTLPLSIQQDTLLLAVANLDDFDAFDQIEEFTELQIQPQEVTDKALLIKTIRRCYPETNKSQALNSAALLLNELINRAMMLRASDIHIEAFKAQKETGAKIFYRIDGVLRSERQINRQLYEELVSRIKILAELDIAEKRTPLDGQINLNLMDDEVNLRLATIPTIHGEHLTLRLLNQDNAAELEKVNRLGLSELHQDMLLSTIEEPNGIALLSGPTGSGKTTTLYASLRHLSTAGTRHLVSIEDPVEKPVTGVTQIKIDSDGRVSFNKALRSVLRHDPDVVMIGEIRDNETADIAVKAALTGHMVLSTLHTNSAVSVLTRLLNLGIPNYLVASTLRLAIAQRLVKRPCTHCMTWEEADPQTQQSFGWNEPVKIPKINGCEYCGHVGYAGRCALYEMVNIDPQARELILNSASEATLNDYFYNQRQLPTLRDDGAQKIKLGWTTISEVNAVTLKEV